MFRAPNIDGARCAVHSRQRVPHGLAAVAASARAAPSGDRTRQGAGRAAIEQSGGRRVNAGEARLTWSPLRSPSLPAPRPGMSGVSACARRRASRISDGCPASRDDFASVVIAADERARRAVQPFRAGSVRSRRPAARPSCDSRRPAFCSSFGSAS